MDLAASKPNSHTRVDAAAISLCLGGSLVWYLVIVGPLLEQKAVTVGMRHEVEAQLGKAAKLQAAVAAARQQTVLMQQELAASAIQLQPATHINKRLAGLTEFLSTCNLQVDDMRTGRVAGGMRYDLVPVTIVGRGPYRQWVRFLHELHSTFPDMSVMQIELTGNPAQPSETERFRLELFWYAAPSAVSRTNTRENPLHTVAAWSRVLHQ